MNTFWKSLFVVILLASAVLRVKYMGFRAHVNILQQDRDWVGPVEVQVDPIQFGRETAVRTVARETHRLDLPRVVMYSDTISQEGELLARELVECFYYNRQAEKKILCPKEEVELIELTGY
ncbi:MAG: hypothetical protein Q8P20_05260 [bacterium]|nr:hypothetical protein [bacterium]